MSATTVSGGRRNKTRAGRRVGASSGVREEVQFFGGVRAVCDWQSSTQLKYAHEKSPPSALFSAQRALSEHGSARVSRTRGGGRRRAHGDVAAAGVNVDVAEAKTRSEENQPRVARALARAVESVRHGGSRRVVRVHVVFSGVLVCDVCRRTLSVSPGDRKRQLEATRRSVRRTSRDASARDIARRGRTKRRDERAKKRARVDGRRLEMQAKGITQRRGERGRNESKLALACATSQPADDKSACDELFQAYKDCRKLNTSASCRRGSNVAEALRAGTIDRSSVRGTEGTNASSNERRACVGCAIALREDGSRGRTRNVSARAVRRSRLQSFAAPRTPGDEDWRNMTILLDKPQRYTSFDVVRACVD